MTHVQVKALFSLKRGLLLYTFILATFVLFTTHHLLQGKTIEDHHPSSPRMKTITSEHDEHIPSYKARRISTNNSSRMSSHHAEGLKLPHITGKKADQGLRLQNHDLDFTGGSESGNSSLALDTTCNDALCTNYLSSWDRTVFSQCHGNATKKVKRFLHGRLPGASLHTGNVTGALNMSYGKCRFMDGRGRCEIKCIFFSSC